METGAAPEPTTFDRSAADEREAAVPARLRRIEALRRGRAPAAAVRAELRGLLRDAEVASTPPSDGEEVVARRREARQGT